MKITVLGSGTSHGVPVVGCSCEVCTSDDPGDKRMRASVYIEGSGGERVTIDAGPEFRLQAVKAGITRLDAIFLTHSHADHIHGLDDVRPLSRKAPLPVYGNEASINEMIERFSYVFETAPEKTQRGGGKPRLMPQVVKGPVHIGRLVFTPVPVKHGILDILGWEVREQESASPEAGVSSGVKSFLYLTDTSAIPPSSLELLKNQYLGVSRQSRVIIIGGLRERPHETHFSFEEALTAASDIGAKCIYLTHICHDHSHVEIEEFCRNFMENRRTLVREPGETEIHPAQDGLEITL